MTRASFASDDSRLAKILEQEAWLHALAKALLADVSKAEDLAQDVMLAALEAPPRADGWGLRAWLATTARRMALRQSSREGARRRVEREAFESRGGEDFASVNRRLEMSEALVHGLRSIPEELRAAVVLRFLESEEYEVIAERLGISGSTARQRVSRGVAELRKRLDSAHGGRQGWLPALASLTLQKEALGPAPFPKTAVSLGSATASSGPLFLSLMTIKKVALAALAMFLVSLPWLVRPAEQGVPRGGEVASRDRTVSLSQPERSLDVAVVADARSRKAIDTLSPMNRLALESTVGRLQVSVRGSKGEAPAEARAAWIRLDGTVDVIELDGEGRGSIPLTAKGMIFASARGHSSSRERLEGEPVPGEAVILRLEPLQSLRGRVLVEGRPPERPLDLMRRDSMKRLVLPLPEHQHYDVLRQLVGKGVLGPRHSWSQTHADGSFEFEDVDAEAVGTIYLPSSYSRVGREDLRSWSYTMPSDSLLLEATARPFIFGRFVWADTAEPISGDFLLSLEQRGQGLSNSESMALAPQGRFEVGIPEASDVEGAMRLLHSSASIHVFPNGGTAVNPLHRVDLSGVSFPYDLGTIRIERSATGVIRVRDLAGMSIPGAMVSGTRWSSALSDSEGLISFPITYPGPWGVYKPGFLPRQIDDELKAWDQEVPMPVTLEPCVALSISTIGYEYAPLQRSIPTCFVEVDPQQVLVASRPGEDDHARLQRWVDAGVENFLVRRGVRLIHDVEYPTGWRVVVECGPEAVVFGPFRGGAEVECGVMDVFGNDLARRRVQLPPAVGTYAEIIDFFGLPQSSLTVRVVDGSGELIPNVGVTASVPGVGGAGNSAPEGTITFKPLAQQGTFRVSVRAPGAVPLQEDGVLLGGEQHLRVVTEPAGELRLRVVDEDGAPAETTRVIVIDKFGVQHGRGGAAGATEITLKQIPLGEITARVRIGTKVLSYSLMLDQDPQEVVVPAAGSIEGRLGTLPPVSEFWSKVHAEIRDVGSGEVLELDHSIAPDATGDFLLLEHLLPGRYHVTVAWVDFTGPDGEDTEGPSVSMPLYQREIEVKASEVTRFEMALKQ